MAVRLFFEHMTLAGLKHHHRAEQVIVIAVRGKARQRAWRVRPARLPPAKWSALRKLSTGVMCSQRRLFGEWGLRQTWN